MFQIGDAFEQIFLPLLCGGQLIAEGGDALLQSNDFLILRRVGQPDGGPDKALHLPGIFRVGSHAVAHDPEEVHPNAL